MLTPSRTGGLSQPGAEVSPASFSKRCSLDLQIRRAPYEHRCFIGKSTPAMGLILPCRASKQIKQTHEIDLLDPLPEAVSYPQFK